MSTEESQVAAEGLFGIFPEGIREDVEGLTLLGYLESTVDFCGHTFVLRTLYGDEELNAGLVSKEYAGTLMESKAFAWAHVGLALVSVDYDTDFCPAIGPDKKAFARARFTYCTSRWFWPLGAHLFREYQALIKRRDDAIEAMREKSAADRTISSPSPDSSTVAGDSETPEILGLLDAEG